MFAPSPAGLGPRARHAGRAYLQVGVETGIHAATPHQLVQMLFDGLLESLAQANGAIACGDIAARSRAIGRAIAIVDEGLRGSLDLSNGGELARNLMDLYTYVVTRLTRANAKADSAIVDECQRLIAPVRDAWIAIKPQRMAA